MDFTSVIIGNPENRRVSLFQKAVQDKGLPKALVIPYRSLLDETISLSDYIKPHSHIRIESPGENFEVEKRIIALGESSNGDISAESAMNLQENYGEIVYPSQWYSGFQKLMRSIQNQVEVNSDTHSWYNHPEEIITMFDKTKTKELLIKRGIPSTSLHPKLDSYDELREYIRREKLSRLFIKLNSSSSASGVIAYECNRKLSREQAYSTIEIDSSSGVTRFFNSLKIKKYTDQKSIECIVNFLFSQGALIEKWIPKSTHKGKAFDLRILAVNGEGAQKIGRLSSSPMTNLHLGNERGDPSDLGISESTWHSIEKSVTDTMKLFPRSLYAGLDVIVPKESERAIILEVNAFGDLLPKILFEGNESYGTQIDAQVERFKK